MDIERKTEDEQTKLWNGPAGRAWINAGELLDELFRPFADLLVEAARDGRVLDVGCGTGSTTLAVARRSGSCTGIDLSQPMIDVARSRAERDGTPASFICGDAQRYAFAPASFDAIVSRFGVMFFEDPVAAFANLRHAATNGARLRFIAWRSAGENPFMTTAERAAAPLLPNLPARRPGTPGQFAFADDGRVRTILTESGWREIAIQPIDVACTMSEVDLVRYLTLLGPVGLTLQKADDQTRARVTEIVRRAFDPYVHGTDVRFTAACWLVDARS